MRQSRSSLFLAVSLITTLGLTPTVSAQQGTASASLVRGLAVSGGAERAQVVLSGDFDVPRYRVHGRDEGRTVIVEVEGARIPDDGLDVEGQAALVATSATSATATGVRLQLRLAARVRHRVRAVPGRVVLELSRLTSAEPAEELEAGPVQVRRVHVERRDGRDRVVVELTRPTEFRTHPTVGRTKVPQRA